MASTSINSSRKGAKPKKQKRKIVIEGIDDPFDGIKKLFNGFCDPRGSRDDDTSTLASTPSIRPDLTPQSDKSRSLQEEGKEKGISYGLDKSHSSILEGDEGGCDADSDAGIAEEDQHVAPRELPELKATHQGSRLRIRRGIEVTIFAILVVLGTIMALQKLEHRIDFNVMYSELMTEHTKLINVFYKDEGGSERSPFSFSRKGVKTREMNSEEVDDAPSIDTPTDPSANIDVENDVSDSGSTDRFHATERDEETTKLEMNPGDSSLISEADEDTAEKDSEREEHTEVPDYTSDHMMDGVVGDTNKLDEGSQIEYPSSVQGAKEEFDASSVDKSAYRGEDESLVESEAQSALSPRPDRIDEVEGESQALPEVTEDPLDTNDMDESIQSDL